MIEPLVTIVVPSFNQGIFLEEALKSIFEQNIPVEVFVLDGGSTDSSIEIIHKWQDRLAGWRSHADAGQAAAINEGIALGKAPYVCWLNSDDWFLPGGLAKLVRALEEQPLVPAVYGRAWNVDQRTGKQTPVWVEAFSKDRLAFRCIISQPATLIRRSAWNSVKGVDESLHLALDFDLWWRLFSQVGPLSFVDDFIAVNREHEETKTKSQRRNHNKEAIAVVRKHYGRVPFKWWVAHPYSVWYKSLKNRLMRNRNFLS